jgi:general secretion pathway protein K
MATASSRGLALISVLWITGLLAVMAASFASSTRTEARLARNQEENAKAEALADAGIHRAAFRLLDLDPETAWRPGRGGYGFALGEGEVRVQIEDEDGKIDLNGAPLELLEGLLTALGLHEPEAQAMADRIGDFRDPDAEPEPLGAEDPTYLEAGLGRGAADRPFGAESELLRVLGMTRELYELMRPNVTVHSGADGVDPTRAPMAVLQALPGMTPALLEAMLATAAAPDPLLALESESLPPDLQAYLLPSREVIYTVRALGRTAAGGNFVREAVIELGASQDSPFLVHAWRRGFLPNHPADPDRDRPLDRQSLLTGRTPRRRPQPARSSRTALG